MTVYFYVNWDPSDSEIEYCPMGGSRIDYDIYSLRIFDYIKDVGKLAIL